VAKKEKNNESNEKESWFARLRKKSRIEIYDVDSFEQKRFFLLSAWNIVVGLMFILILVVTATWYIIAHTPLRQSIPGYPKISETEKLKRQQLDNLKLLAELSEKERITNQYNKSLLEILSEQAPTDPSLSGDSILPIDTAMLNNITFETSDKDSILRNIVTEKEKYGFNTNKSVTGNASDNIAGVFFFTPLKGEVSGEIDTKIGHYGIDIKAPKDEAVKSTLAGTVIYTDWSPENGHVIHVQHTHNLVSVYKHCSYLLKEQGDLVKTGEPIAIVGNSGSLSLGTHLHFELWYNGVAQNPKQFINFE
jgi:murein DD-endopeptidase MepM/ murein hydrolase activator NlpD